MRRTRAAQAGGTSVGEGGRKRGKRPCVVRPCVRRFVGRKVLRRLALRGGSCGRALDLRGFGAKNVSVGARANMFDRLRGQVSALMFCVLLLPLALASSLPAFARAIGGPAAHVCHCAASLHGEVTCACPLCNPDRDDLATSDEAIRGQCGDDDIVYGAKLGLGVNMAPPSSVAPMDLRVARFGSVAAADPPHRSTSPPRRPPKA